MIVMKDTLETIELRVYYLRVKHYPRRTRNDKDHTKLKTFICMKEINRNYIHIIERFKPSACTPRGY